MTWGDLRDVVAVHRTAFSGFFLDLMGERVIEYYYSFVLKYHYSLALVAENDERRVVGFVVGFINPEEFYSKFYSERYKLVPLVAWAVLRRPRLIGAVLKSQSRVGGYVGRFGKNVAELSSIAVTIQGQGLGTRLLNEFIRQAMSSAVKAVTLTTDLDDNSPARSFYIRHGFEESGLERRGKRTMVVYELTF